jgi:hypothetical protein
LAQSKRGPDLRAFVCVVASLLAALMPIPLMAQAAPHAVLVLEATTPNTSYFIGVNRAFNSAIATESLCQIYVYVETLAVRDFEQAGYPALLREFFREKYRGKNLGAIVAYNTLALLYATRLRDAPNSAKAGRNNKGAAMR